MTPVRKAPKHLSAESRRWWETVEAEYELEPHHVHLLTLACEARDVAATARRKLAKCGLTYTDRFGAPRTRPEVAIARGAMIAHARLVRELRLDVMDPDEDRIPDLPGGRHRHA
jgi:phage terminase small subunit